MLPKQQAWTFLSRVWILQNPFWIYDERDSCESKLDTIYLFGWVYLEIFWDVTTWWFVHTMLSSILEILRCLVLEWFLSSCLKNQFWWLENRKWFLVQINEIPKHKHCLSSQYEHMCITWARLNKVCYGCGHNQAH
jgi:hypothetical protein